MDVMSTDRSDPFHRPYLSIYIIALYHITTIIYNNNCCSQPSSAEGLGTWVVVVNIYEDMPRCMYIVILYLHITIIINVVLLSHPWRFIPAFHPPDTLTLQCLRILHSNSKVLLCFRLLPSSFVFKFRHTTSRIYIVSSK